MSYEFIIVIIVHDNINFVMEKIEIFVLMFTESEEKGYVRLT